VSDNENNINSTYSGFISVCVNRSTALTLSEDMSDPLVSLPYAYIVPSCDNCTVLVSCYILGPSTVCPKQNHCAWVFGTGQHRGKEP
jgi:hypothetical protein